MITFLLLCAKVTSVKYQDAETFVRTHTGEEIRAFLEIKPEKTDEILAVTPKNKLPEGRLEEGQDPLITSRSVYSEDAKIEDAFPQLPITSSNERRQSTTSSFSQYSRKSNLKSAHSKTASDDSSQSDRTVMIHEDNAPSAHPSARNRRQSTTSSRSGKTVGFCEGYTFPPKSDSDSRRSSTDSSGSQTSEKNNENGGDVASQTSHTRTQSNVSSGSQLEKTTAQPLEVYTDQAMSFQTQALTPEEQTAIREYLLTSKKNETIESLQDKISLSDKFFDGTLTEKDFKKSSLFSDVNINNFKDLAPFISEYCKLLQDKSLPQEVKAKIEKSLDAMKKIALIKASHKKLQYLNSLLFILPTNVNHIPLHCLRVIYAEQGEKQKYTLMLDQLVNYCAQKNGIAPEQIYNILTAQSYENFINTPALKNVFDPSLLSIADYEAFIRILQAAAPA